MHADVLLLSGQRSVHADILVERLKEADLTVFRLNADVFPDDYRFAAKATQNSIESGLAQGALEPSRDQFRCGHIHSVPEASDRGSIHPRRLPFFLSERQAALHALCSVSTKRWTNPPDAELLPENKFLQLVDAHEVGLRVPPTAVTNAITGAEDIIEPSGAILKALSDRIVFRAEERRDDEVLLTRRARGAEIGDDSTLVRCPLFLQEEIDKAEEIRIMVIGDSHHAISISWQDRSVSEIAKLDWRRAEPEDLVLTPTHVPRSILEGCRSLMQTHNLDLAAFDFIVDDEDAFWFLEYNPSFQWMWLDDELAAPVTRDVVGLIEDYV